MAGTISAFVLLALALTSTAYGCTKPTTGPNVPSMQQMTSTSTSTSPTTTTTTTTTTAPACNELCPLTTSGGVLAPATTGNTQIIDVDDIACTGNGAATGARADLICSITQVKITAPVEILTGQLQIQIECTAAGWNFGGTTIAQLDCLA